MVTKGQIEIISRIIDRAERDGANNLDRLSMINVLGNATETFNLQLEDMLNADNFNFYHDYVQLPMHFDERFGIFDNRFLPRFAGLKNRDVAVAKESKVFEISSDTRKVDNWIEGYVLQDHIKYKFTAKVFDENSKFGIDEGRISKLTVRRVSDNEEIVNFDRGWDKYPREKALLSMLKKLIKQLKELPYSDGRL